MSKVATDSHGFPKDWTRKPARDANLAPSPLDPWLDRNAQCQCNNEAIPVSGREWRGIWRDLLPYVLLVAALGGYAIWAFA